MFGWRSTSVSSCPYQSAYEGVFTSSFHIKEYLSWFAGQEQGQGLSSVTPATTASKKVATCTWMCL